MNSTPSSEKNGNDRSVLLITVSGQDSPGITSGLTEILSSSEVRILDIDQAVIYRQLFLSLLLEIPDKAAEKAVLKDLLFRATELGLKMEYRGVDPGQLQEQDLLTSQRQRYAITLLGEPIPARALHEVTASLAQHHLNIEVIRRLSEGDFGCVELLVSTGTVPVDPAKLKPRLLRIAGEQRIDIALQSEGLFRRAKRMVVFDMDSTLIQAEVIDEFARELGKYDQVAEITERAMNGGMDYNESLKQRCALLKGLTLEDIERVYQRIELTPGANELIQVLKRLGYKVALISGGFLCIADRIKKMLDIDYAYANQLEVKNGALTGNVIPPIVNAARKADLLDLIAKQERIQLDQVIAIGDGANDLPMLEKAGLGIAFNAKPAVRSQAQLAISRKNLKSILYLLGLNGRDVTDALIPIQEGLIGE